MRHQAPIAARHLEYRFWIRTGLDYGIPIERDATPFTVYSVMFGAKLIRKFRKKELAEKYRLWLFEMPGFHKYFGGNTR